MDAAIERPAQHEDPALDRPRVGSLDGLRALGVALVVAFHVKHTALPGGRLGVDIFFPLSGFLITTIIYREVSRSGGFRFGRFYWRRLVRLYPALIVTVLLSATVYRYMTDDGGITAWAKSAALAATYTTNAGIVAGVEPARSALSPTWTLGMEEQFYLLWPIVLLFLFRRAGLRAVLGGSLALVALSWISLLAFGWKVEFRPDARSGALMIGCAVALAVIRWELPERIARLALWVAAPALVAWVAITSVWSQDFVPASVPVASLLVAVMIPALLVDPRHVVARVLAVGPARWLGLRSYSVYLIHLPVFYAVEGLTGLTEPRAPVVAVPVALGLAELMYRLVELPALRRRDRKTVASAAPATTAATP